MPSSARKTAARSPLKSPPKTGTGGSNKYKVFDCFGEDGTVYCFCDFDPRLEAVLKTARNGREENVGRQFWTCDNPSDQCKFFLWTDESESFGGPPPPNGRDSSDEGFLRGSSSSARNEKKTKKLATPPAKKKQRTASGRAHDLSDCDDEVYGEWEDASHLFRRSPSPPSPSARGKGRRLNENEGDRTSDLAAATGSQSQNGNGNGGGKTKKRRAARSPSPDWPDADELQQKVDDKDREIARLMRMVKDAERAADKAKEEVGELKGENQGLLGQLYPELFPKTQENA
ncbi:hypothetical protein JCM6882_000195 [Rhodosporidiobolus microsporus]